MLGCQPAPHVQRGGRSYIFFFFCFNFLGGSLSTDFSLILSSAPSPGVRCQGKSKPDAGALKVEKTAAVAADAATTKKKKKKKSKRAKRKAAREAKTAEEEAGDDDNAGAGGDDDAEFNDSFVFGRSLAEGAGEAGTLAMMVRSAFPRWVFANDALCCFGG